LVLEAEVNELAPRVRGREQALDQDQGEIAKQREQIDEDRDFRVLTDARGQDGEDLRVDDLH
jgi:hypothetical protein